MIDYPVICQRISFIENDVKIRCRPVLNRQYNSIGEIKSHRTRFRKLSLNRRWIRKFILCKEKTQDIIMSCTHLHGIRILRASHMDIIVQKLSLNQERFQILKGFRFC